ncbi:MAG TPA: hypothetical protein VLZ77_05410, partial [Acidimicrobiales bacterium]|nr:hypothetical protein [Acidimicrobiales bacterium]
TRPPVMFLDEPTTGLDPTSRQRVWDAIRVLLGEGVTVLLTTQYLDEADALADQIVVIDHGKVIASGTPHELKEASRSAHLEVKLAAPHAGAMAAVAPLVAGPVHLSADGSRLRAGVDATSGLATAVVRALDAAGALVDNIEVRQPSLDDVFFSLTGGRLADDDEDADVPEPAAAPGHPAGAPGHTGRADSTRVHA